MEKPQSPRAVPPLRPMTLEESARALRELNGQLQALNARLEYLALMLKLVKH